MDEETKSASSFKGMSVVSALILGAMFAISYWGWSQIGPGEKVPMHWGPDGEVDGYGGRNSLFLMPLVAAGVALLLAVVPYIEPRRGHLLRSSKAYKAMWIGLMGFFALFHLAIVLVALGHAVSINLTVSLLTGILFIIIGKYMGEVRSNFFFGVRTPWTLSSELSWNKTHRLAGRLFVGWGVSLIVAAILNPAGTWILWLVLGGAAVLVAVVLVYSYVVWKGDPARKVGED